MSVPKPSAKPSSWGKSFLWLALAVVCFNAAYTSIKVPAAGLLIFGYAYGLVRLGNQPTVRRAFYFGLAAGFLCAAPQLFFFARIFGLAAIPLWLVLAFWTGLFVAMVCGCIRRWGKNQAAWLIPIIWTGVEYFRSELYYFKFSWLNVGYAFPDCLTFVSYGMYGAGFFVLAVAAIAYRLPRMKRAARRWFFVVLIVAVLGALLLQINTGLRISNAEPVAMPALVGVQLEFPPVAVIPKLLDQALAKNTNAPVFVLSEYTLDSPVPELLKNWCRERARYLIVGGKDFVTNDVFYDTAFVVGTNGDIIFKQAKSVPVQCFQDGLPAKKQEVWNSPWGKIGICICYDLSYTRVTDELVRQGAQLLIVPTMDVEDWGRHQHELHSRGRARARGGIRHPDFPRGQLRHFAGGHRRRRGRGANQNARQRRNLRRATAAAATGLAAAGPVSRAAVCRRNRRCPGDAAVAHLERQTREAET